MPRSLRPLLNNNLEFIGETQGKTECYKLVNNNQGSSLWHLQSAEDQGGVIVDAETVKLLRGRIVTIIAKLT